MLWDISSCSLHSTLGLISAHKRAFTKLTSRHPLTAALLDTLYHSDLKFLYLTPHLFVNRACFNWTFGSHSGRERPKVLLGDICTSILKSGRESRKKTRKILFCLDLCITQPCLTGNRTQGVSCCLPTTDCFLLSSLMTSSGFLPTLSRNTVTCIKGQSPSKRRITSIVVYQ